MKSTLRTFRSTPQIDNLLKTIAKIEDRTVSKVVQRLVIEGIKNYTEKYPEIKEKETKGLFDYIQKNGLELP